MNNCDHQFFEVKRDVEYTDIERSIEVLNSIHAIVVCAHCGQPRRIYADGRVVIVKEYGEIRRQKIS